MNHEDGTSKEPLKITKENWVTSITKKTIVQASQTPVSQTYIH